MNQKNNTVRASHRYLTAMAGAAAALFAAVFMTAAAAMAAFPAVPAAFNAVPAEAGTIAREQLSKTAEESGPGLSKAAEESGPGLSKAAEESGFELSEAAAKSGPEGEKEKLREAVEELEKRGLTPDKLARRTWEFVTSKDFADRIHGITQRVREITGGIRKKIGDLFGKKTGMAKDGMSSGEAEKAYDRAKEAVSGEIDSELDRAKEKVSREIDRGLDKTKEKVSGEVEKGIDTAKDNIFAELEKTAEGIVKKMTGTP